MNFGINNNNNKQDYFNLEEINKYIYTPLRLTIQYINSDFYFYFFSVFINLILKSIKYTKLINYDCRNYKKLKEKYPKTFKLKVSILRATEWVNDLLSYHK